MAKTSKGNQRRQQIMEFIRAFRKERGYSPSQWEIAQGIGTSASSIARHLKVLDESGQIIRIQRGARALGLAPDTTALSAPSISDFQ
jgi:SOS-response transcriptional repressor LexA